ncbi:PD-(D/E)XK nuclease family protein [Campylobacter sp.]|uniref:PD-(D/E)XK nuclease family protein n=1 Tax=Campylobacter sp. TaxID=205 RepID=UPI00259C7B71|nr:PD-(D/E)XK nuclease family protein [Campylobacter sp.]MBQ8819373.1 PD-(D/E)XK nuclease family protein [Campylobacter sp.]
MQNNSLFVLSSSRNVRDFYSSKLNSNCLLPKAISIADFFNEAIYVPNRRYASQTECLLHMKDAVSKVKNISEILNIKNEFLLFLKNSNYLFSFFKELSREKRTISDLSMADTYSSYDEHLAILDNLGRIYRRNLTTLGLYDEITLSDCYEINSNFISNFDKIEFRIDGNLSSLEWEILTKISSKTQLFIDVDCSKFNKKIIKEIVHFTNLNLEIGYNYNINLSNKTINNSSKIKINSSINLKSFRLRSLQAAFVFDEISKMIRAGIEPQNIAVILPDESFALVLQNLDENNMLNYAMGKSLKNNPIYTLLHNLKEAIIQDINYEFNENYIKDIKTPNQIIATLNSFKLPTQIYIDIKNRFNSKVNYDSFENLIKSVLDTIKINLEINQIIAIELFNIKNLLSQIDLKFSEIFELFLLNFANKKESIVGGGLVTVMGILESRSRSYDGVVIVDFNDSFVPKRSQKEMFLSSSVRKNAGLISHSDRENLQRFYYESLINRAKIVSISYVKDDENMLSRFIKDFDNIVEITSPQSSYENALYQGGIAINLNQKEIIKTHNFFDSAISFSRLNTYLECPRRYYYKYIKNIKESRFGNKDALEFGNIVHSTLCEYFKKSPYNFDKNEFLSLYNNYENTTPTLKNELFKIKLDAFESEQNKHFKDGFSVKDCELGIEAEFNGVPIMGNIDRVDINGDDIWLIDYKTGNIVDKSLQLAFYQMLYLAKFHKETKGYFYSLKDNKFVENKKSIDDLSCELNKLKEISNTQICFTQNTKNCNNCPYETLCLRGLK